MSGARRADESFEDYRKRRKEEEKAEKEHMKGTVIYDGIKHGPKGQV